MRVISRIDMRGSLPADLRDVLVYVWQTPRLAAAMCVAFLVNLTAFPLMTQMMPYVAKEIYRTGQAGVGYLVASFAARGGFDPGDYGKRIADIFVEGRIVGRGRTTSCSMSVGRSLATTVAFTKMPGVITSSGSRKPSRTRSASATQTRPLIATSGLKLRAVAR